ncbi:hypothetical protein HLB25_19535 [Dickeya dadantii]|uniref:hypothetical protein n=1 Tax=Dickeya dadantii TaxID=204038 RepID=UPI001495B36A|nr:hypothetical protein [Dickeya dadantii]NPE56466.1 hypothetical protein [Dickeya dadantii]NPE68749.1 hypothetical protein [Dickeya dadantii]
MSDKENTNLNLVAGMEGHLVPAMQPVVTGTGTKVPTVQATSFAGQQPSSSTSQNVPQGNSTPQNS